MPFSETVGKTCDFGRLDGVPPTRGYNIYLSTTKWCLHCGPTFAVILTGYVCGLGASIIEDSTSITCLTTSDDIVVDQLRVLHKPVRLKFVRYENETFSLFKNSIR